MNNDAMISIKLSDDEKKLISDNAKNLNMSVSEFIRISSLSSFSKSILLRKENDALQAELKEMKVQLNYYSEIEAAPYAIVLPTNKAQRELLFRIYGDFYTGELGAPKTQEENILNFLIDDATYPHQGINESTWAQIASVTMEEVLRCFPDALLACSS